MSLLLTQTVLFVIKDVTIIALGNPSLDSDEIKPWVWDVYSIGAAVFMVQQSLYVS